MTLLSSQAQLECKFMIGLSQGLGNGILVLTLDLDGVDADVWGFGWPYYLVKFNIGYSEL